MEQAAGHAMSRYKLPFLSIVAHGMGALVPIRVRLNWTNVTSTW